MGTARQHAIHCRGECPTYKDSSVYPVLPVELSQAVAEHLLCLTAAMGTLISFLLNWR